MSAPLARRLADLPPVDGARIKERAGDFLVEELPLYEPSGEGEHLYLRIVKQDLAHQDLVSVLCAHFGVGPQAIGTAGMKDRCAVTSQTVSVHLPRRPELRSIQDDRIQVLWATWHANKLRRGHLAGNRFSIRVRGLEPFRAPAVWRCIRALEAHGVPNGFGPQRFGMRGDNHLLGAMLLQDRLGELADLLCGEEKAGTVEGRRAAAARARGADAAATVRAVPPPTRELWLDAWQSAVFNRVLDARISAGTLDRVLPGDVAVKHPNGAMFLVDDAAMAEEGDRAPGARAARFEISATGPLPGPDAMRASGAVAEAERAAIAATGVDPARLERAGTRPSGDRRPLRVRLSNPELESGFDEHGPYVRVAFDLPPGAYATVVLREALGDGLVDASREAARS